MDKTKKTPSTPTPRRITSAPDQTAKTNHRKHTLDPEKLSAVLRRDPAYDGQFFYAVKSTGIFCRPSCKSRPPKPDNLVFFDSAAQAQTAGYRPCKRCRPDLLNYDPYGPAAEALHQSIETHLLDRERLNAELKALGADQSPVKAAFKKRFGCTPAELILHKRLSLAADGLLTTRHAILQIALDCGFASQSAFYDAFRRAYHTSPGQYRKTHTPQNEGA